MFLLKIRNVFKSVRLNIENRSISEMKDDLSIFPFTVVQ